MVIDRWDLCFFLSFVSVIFICPYTRSDENYIMQAVHDMVVHKYDIDQYDHLRYPEEVKKTGLGALGLGFMIFPYFYLMTALGFSIEVGMYLTRIALGIMNFASIFTLRKSVRKVYGKKFAHILMMLMN